VPGCSLLVPVLEPESVSADLRRARDPSAVPAGHGTLCGQFDLYRGLFDGEGAAAEADLQMIQDLGFEIEGDVGADLVSARNEIETGMSPRAGTRPALTVELK